MNGFLLDTNVISEWRKPKPSRRVAAFIEQQSRAQLFTSAVCFAELRRGARMIGDSKHREVLEFWIENVLRGYFGRNAMALAEDVIIVSLDIIERGEKLRSPVSQVHALIAATARFHNLSVVTRDTKDMVKMGVPVLNPWTGERFNGA